MRESLEYLSKLREDIKYNYRFNFLSLEIELRSDFIACYGEYTSLKEYLPVKIKELLSDVTRSTRYSSTYKILGLTREECITILYESRDKIVPECKLLPNTLEECLSDTLKFGHGEFPSYVFAQTNLAFDQRFEILKDFLLKLVDILESKLVTHSVIVFNKTQVAIL